ncbi:PRC-barrel domain-containing protein [Desulfonatronum thioautotrophicum]|uniref:PRC-barrel domain-containing protein n=1 Tax=Desulfonatronum thioautotrophicum TaxID=617001 RepID=UPI0006994A38|nr:PRC-barrel domain-containing protein [Desulfonatronum thioautotrophicum]
MKKIIGLTVILSMLVLSSVFANTNHQENKTFLVVSSENLENGTGQDGNDPETLGDVYRRTPRTPHWGMIPAEGYAQVGIAELILDELLDADVYDEAHEVIANVNEVLLGSDGQPDRLVIDVGGFLGIGARSVAFDTDDLDFFKGPADDLRIYIPMTEDELLEKPEYTD